MDLYVFFKVLTSLIVVIAIILLSKVSGQSMRSIFLTKGKLRLGLTIGLVTFLVFLVTSVPVSMLLYGGENLTYVNLVSWAPWVLSFVFANSFKEELQYRGLFLKKYEMFLGLDVSNFLQTMVFTSAHLGESYSSVFFVFLVLVFLLGLGFGAVMQKTDSLLGSVLFHAGSDIPVILGIFSNL
jgi:membrane protease YdiL (CAAX protease family)